MTRMTVASLALSILSLVMVTIASIKTRSALARLDEIEGKAPAVEGGPAKVTPAGQPGLELDALRKEIADLKQPLLGLQAGAPLAKIEKDVIARAMEDVIKDREQKELVKWGKELEDKLNNMATKWVGKMTKDLKLTPDQALKVQEILARQAADGVQVKMGRAKDAATRLTALGIAAREGVFQILTEAQKADFPRIDLNWHEGRLGHAE